MNANVKGGVGRDEPEDTVRGQVRKGFLLDVTLGGRGSEGREVRIP